jgi:hypothetical protein
MMAASVRSGRELDYFLMLSRDDQCGAIRRMAAGGLSDYTIASATRLSVEQVRQIIGNRASGIST